MISLKEERVKTEKRISEQETIHPVIEAIKRDAGVRPEEYVRNFRIPAEGE